MNADGGALAPSSQCEMEFLLVHESLDELFNVLVVPGRATLRTRAP